MQLPADFNFNQGNLGDFIACRRRFYLRHVRQLAWPALLSAPAIENERHIQRGADFHHLVQQHLLGVPAERLGQMVADEQLAGWWDNYVNHLNLTGIENLSSVYPEVALSATLAGQRLVAKYDLVVVTNDNQAMIYDWKTSQSLPKPAWLEQRMQTRLYPYLLVRAGGQLNQGVGFQPEQVSMRYWFASFPEQPHTIEYSPAQYLADEAYLTALIETILSLDEDGFPLTTDERQCRYCVYRSLCERGQVAGLLSGMEATDELEEEQDLELDFEQIGEIAY
jgi:hypothetical protein